jgi:tripartite-type tricarboxylate transporter receptor subunit TctC
MKKLLVVLICIAVASTLLFAEGAKEAQFPQRNIEIIVPYAAGGGTDAVARAIAQFAEPHLGQPITIINKTGGGGAVGWAEAAKARADGYTLTMFAPNIVNLALMNLSPVSYKDFEPVLMFNNDPGTIVVAKKNANLNVVEMLKDNRYKSGGENPNFYLLTIQAVTNVFHQDIPYGGAAERVPAVLGGHVDFAIVNVGEAKGQLDAGELVPLAVMAEKRLAAIPNVPTLKELGIDAVMGSWRGLAAPKGTPADVLKILEDAFTKAMNEQGFKDFMQKAAFNVDYKNSGDFWNFMVEQDAATKAMLSK